MVLLLMLIELCHMLVDQEGLHHCLPGLGLEMILAALLIRHQLVASTMIVVLPVDFLTLEDDHFLLRPDEKVSLLMALLLLASEITEVRLQRLLHLQAIDEMHPIRHQDLDIVFDLDNKSSNRQTHISASILLVLSASKSKLPRPYIFPACIGPHTSFRNVLQTLFLIIKLCHTSLDNWLRHSSAVVQVLHLVHQWHNFCQRCATVPLPSSIRIAARVYTFCFG